MESEDQATSDMPCEVHGGVIRKATERKAPLTTPRRESDNTAASRPTHQLVSRYGFLKLAVVRPPDFDEFVSGCGGERKKVTSL